MVVTTAVATQLSTIIQNNTIQCTMYNGQCQFYLYRAFTEGLATPKCFAVKCNIAGRHKKNKKHNNK
jgi:hypothetical protein